MTKEYKNLRTRNEKTAFVDRALNEERDCFLADRKRVEPSDPEYRIQHDLYICRQFALGAMVSFDPRTKNQVHPEYLEALKPASIPGHNQIPLKYTVVSGARGAFVEEPFAEQDWQHKEMAHCINAVQIGGSGKSIDDWVFIEPQDLGVFRREQNGGIDYMNNPTIVSIKKSVGHKRKYDGEDKWFHGDYLDSRVKFSTQGDRADEEFLQAYRLEPRNITGYSVGPLPELFDEGTERWLISKGKLDEFRERAGKIRIGKPSNGHKQHPDAPYCNGENGTQWYDISQRELTSHVKAFVELGVVTPDNISFLRRVTTDPKLHKAFDEGIKTPVSREAVNHLMRSTG